MSTAPLPETPLTAALRTGDQSAVAGVLGTTELQVPTVLVDGRPRPQVATDGQGRRALLAFTSRESLSAWAPVDRAGVLTGRDAAEMAREQSVDVVVLDAAGPYPVELTPGQLADLVDGVVAAEDGTRLVGDLEVAEAEPGDAWARPVVADTALAPRPLLFRRRHAGGTSLTVGVAAAPLSTVHDLVSRLGDVARERGPVDVVELTPEVYAAVQRRLPTAAVPPADSSG